MYTKTLRIPMDRIGVLIGKSGASKKRIEDSCGVRITIDSKSGDVTIDAASDIESVKPFKATEIVTAIGRGFSAEIAMKLLDDLVRLHVLDLREFAGKSGSALIRMRSRIIGENGRARRNMEQLGHSHICVYGKTVAIIGNENRLRTVTKAIVSLLNGGMHATAYGKLEAANRRDRREKMLLWEGQYIGD